jgi:uncharacterized membrane protein YqjE
MRLLWSLPKAAPALLRHLMGYAELFGQDIEQMHRDFGARLVAFAVLALAAFFVIFSGCLLIVAMTWDGPHRVSAIAWMGGGFLLVAVIAAAYRSQVASSQGSLLGTVRREWGEDRAILDHILAPERSEHGGPRSAQ